MWEVEGGLQKSVLDEKPSKQTDEAHQNHVAVGRGKQIRERQFK